MASEASDSVFMMSTRRFVYGLADDAGRLSADLAYTVGEAVGFTSTQVRLAVRRMAEAGLVDVEGRGRKGTVTLTEAGLEARYPDLVWIGMLYRTDAGLDPWDGVWHLAAFEIPEGLRAARDGLRGQILEMAGAQLARSLYVSPYGWAPWITAVAEIHDVADRLTIVETTSMFHGGSADPLTIAAGLWPIEDLHRQYEAYLAKWRGRALPDPAADEIGAVTAALEATADLAVMSLADPGLPTELLPDGFAGPAARALYREITASLAKSPLFAATHIYSAYESAISSALAKSPEEFWTWARQQTVLTAEGRPRYSLN